MHLALGVEYDGSAFNGFQAQRNAPSVQDELERALSRIADCPVRITAAGRTDAGVHATGQVVGFSSPVERPLSAWQGGVNALTCAAVKVRWAQRVAADFHPRFAALSRRYLYLWYEDVINAPLLEGRAVRAPQTLDDDAMHRAAQPLLGEHDFTSYRAAGCQSQSAYRNIHRIGVSRRGSLVLLDVTANAFLLHMVRNLAGALLQVGLGSRDESWPAQLLRQRDRTRLGPTGPPGGLYLVAVHYAGYRFPQAPAPPVLRAAGTLDRL